MEYAEDGEDEVTIENEQRENSSSVSWLDLGDAVVDDVQECFADEVGAGFSLLRVGNSRVLGQLDTRLGAPRMILVMRLFSRSTPTQFVKQTRQLCVGARVAWSLQGWSVWRRPLRQ